MKGLILNVKLSISSFSAFPPSIQRDDYDIIMIKRLVVTFRDFLSMKNNLENNF